MTDYDRVPAASDTIDAARDVKERNGDEWTDVFEFYAERRDDADVGRKWTESEIRDIVQGEIEEYANGGRR